MWPDDPELRSAALDLYGAVWPHLPPGIEQAGAWGSDWFAASTPFLARAGERILAHAGVVTCRLMVAGRRVEVAAVHGVCVHPDHRRQGLCRQVMEAALEHVDLSGAATTILWSEKVDLYRRFDFTPVPESVFVAEAPEPVATRSFRLDLEESDHRELLVSTLRTRAPVSRIAAAADTGGHFLIDLALWPEARDFLIALPDHDTVAVCETEGSLLRLYDVLGPGPPPTAALVGAVQEVAETPIERLEIYLTPDLLDLPAEPAPHPVEDVLMVRGEPLLGADAPPFAFSLFTRT